ncbi:MAG TPA: hypothetical protein DEA96_12980 [Leptospiraceae bacterium]|nr:hypothetical protein [Spirochaetaceae bacterium]HBS05876.1 hypothetical protein [Leptospiraceae bacterium]
MARHPRARYYFQVRGFVSGVDFESQGGTCPGRIRIPGAFGGRMLLLLWFLLYFGGPLQPLQAFHGIWLPAFGADQAGLAGAFYSAYGSPLVVEENPALLSRVQGHSFQASLAVNRATIEYRDRYLDPATGTFYNNDRTFQPVAPLPALGYAYGGQRWSYGFAIYAQGGGGAGFENMLRAYPGAEARSDGVDSSSVAGNQNSLAKEEVNVRLALLKATPAMAYRMGSLSLGLGLDVVHATKRMDRSYNHLETGALLPGGIHYRSDSAWALGAKLGLSYDLEDLTLAASFTSSSRFYLDGDLRVDSYSNPDQVSGVSRYMEWPARFVVGLEYRRGPYRIVADVSHTLWSYSMNSLLFSLDAPLAITPIGSRSPYLRMNLRWRDQTAVSVGIERRMDRLALRAGYSYGGTPQTARGLSPLLGTTVEHHISLGLGWFFGEEAQPSSVDLALQYSFPNTMKGVPFSEWWLGHAIQTEPLRPALFEFEKRTRVFSLYLGLSYRWGGQSS